MKKLTVAKLKLNRTVSGGTVGLSNRRIFDILVVYLWDDLLITPEDKAEIKEAHQAIRNNVRGISRPKVERYAPDDTDRTTEYQAIDAVDQAIEWTKQFTKTDFNLKSTTLTNPKTAAGRISSLVPHYLNFIDKLESYKPKSRHYDLAKFIELI